MNKHLRSFSKVWLPLGVMLAYFFLYVPIFVLVIYSFNNAAFPAPWSGFSLMWYKELFHNLALWKAFYNSFVVASSATLLSIFMSLGLIYYHVMGGQVKGLLTLFYTNIIIPEIVLAVGLISFLTFLAIPLGLITLIVAHTVLGLGYVVPLVYARFINLDPRLIEASLDLGATPTQTFFKVIAPMLAPSLIAAGLLIFIISFDDFVLSFFVAGSESQTLSLYIYSMIKTGVTPVINALSTFLLALSSLLVLFFTSLNVKSKIF